MPNELLRSVGMECFVNCFDDFERESKGQCERDATIRAMFERGGADTDQSAATKAYGGVMILKKDMAMAALVAVSKSHKVPSDVRARALEIVNRIGSPQGVTPDPGGLGDEFTAATEGTLREELTRRRERDREIAERRLFLDGFRCQNQNCGFTAASKADVRPSTALDVHHVNPLSDTGPVLSTIDELVTLCANCHRLIHALATKHARHRDLSVEFLQERMNVTS